MENISFIELSGDEDKVAKQQCREDLGIGYDVETRIAENKNFLETLSEVTVRQLDRKIKHGENLTFEEALCGMSYVLAATNARFFNACRPAFSKAVNNGFSPTHALAMGTAFIQLMAAKEALQKLTAEEVAGIAAAGMMDTMIRLDFEKVIETCGMGGDKGFRQNGSRRKTINISTLSSLLLGSLGLPAVKHGSYSNTSAVGSTEAIELFGAKTVLRSQAQVMRIWEQCGFCYLDAHWCKTIHDLSHLLKMETINHVVGPMSPPFSRGTEINKLMGVNEKIHPETVARAYNILHAKGLQKIGGVAIICGLEQNAGQIDPRDLEAVKKFTVLDELSPFSSVVSIARGSEFLGTFIVKPEDFGIAINADKIQIPNTQMAIHEANCVALQGKDDQLSSYLAMNAALGLFVTNHLNQRDALTKNGPNRDRLQSCYAACLAALRSGQAWEFLTKYVETSKSVCAE